MDNESMMDQLFQTEDSVMLKNSAQSLIDKFLIIGMNIIEQKKFKK
jgi:hypothetical protein